MHRQKESLLRSPLRGCRSCIDSIAVRLAWSTAPQGMLKYVHRNSCHRYYKGCDSAHFKGAVCCIEFLSFLLRKQQVNIFKESQISDGNCDLFAFVSMNHPKKSLLRSTLRGNRSCIHSIAMRLAWSIAPQGRLNYDHIYAGHRHQNYYDSKHFNKTHKR